MVTDMTRIITTIRGKMICSNFEYFNAYLSFSLSLLFTLGARDLAGVLVVGTVIALAGSRAGEALWSLM